MRCPSVSIDILAQLWHSVKHFWHICTLKNFGGNHRKNLWVFAVYCPLYNKYIYTYQECLFCVGLVVFAIVRPSTVSGFGLCCVAVLMLPPLWACAVACVPCAVRVSGLLVRPSVWLLWWLWWACLGCFVAVACPLRCGFPLPLPFWAVLWGVLAVFGGGAVSLLVRCFSWHFGTFGGFVWWLPFLWLVVGHPVPIFGRVSGGRITPLKFPRKIF